MQKPILLSTTSSIETHEIEEYLGVVSHQIVIGANIFRDVFSSFRDIIGGSVKGYQKDLDKWKGIAFDELTNKANEREANALIGLKIDFEDVSGGGKSMFMVSVSATAVKLKDLQKQLTPSQVVRVSYEEIDYEIQRSNLRQKVENHEYEYLDDSDIKEFIEYNVDAGELVLSRFLEEKVLDPETIEYFKNSSHKPINQYLKSQKYKNLNRFYFTGGEGSEKGVIYEFLDQIGWYELPMIHYLLETDDPILKHRALMLTTLTKEYYNESDISSLKAFAKALPGYFEEFPIIRIEEKKFGKNKEKWLCLSCNDLNALTKDECSYCSANIYGYKSKELTPVNRSDYLMSFANILEEKLA